MDQDHVSKILRTWVFKKTPAEKIAGNEDLLSEILLRLPVRSLIRFKCVSKPWLHLISSSRFSHAHTTRNLGSLSVSGLIFPNVTGFDFIGVDGARPIFPSSLEFMENPLVRIFQSCNGLVLCSTTKKDDYYVCNPTTKKFSSIPPPPMLDHYGVGMNLVFDPSRSPHFKLVYFTWSTEPYTRLSPDAFTYSTHLYSSDSQSWSSLDESSDTFLRSVNRNNSGVLCNGSLYWLYADQWKLLRFEVDEHRFSTITMNVDTNLIGIRHNNYPVYLCQCKGKLCLVQSIFASNLPADMVVYEMGNVCSEWVVKYTVIFPVEVLRLDAAFEARTCTILAAFEGQKDDDDEDDMQLLLKLKYGTREPDVILYGVKEKTAIKMPVMDFFHIREAYPYIESLSPLF